jgi:hypothetical protein
LTKGNSWAQNFALNLNTLGEAAAHDTMNVKAMFFMQRILCKRGSGCAHIN